LLHRFYVRGRTAVNSAFVEKWRVSLVACCKIVSYIFSGRTKENTDNQGPSTVSGDLDQDATSRSPGLHCDSLTSRLAECLANWLIAPAVRPSD
jgi:hypothetical protein